MSLPCPHSPSGFRFALHYPAALGSKWLMKMTATVLTLSWVDTKSKPSANFIKLHPLVQIIYLLMLLSNSFRTARRRSFCKMWSLIWMFKAKFKNTQINFWFWSGAIFVSQVRSVWRWLWRVTVRINWSVTKQVQRGFLVITGWQVGDCVEPLVAAIC